MQANLGKLHSLSKHRHAVLSIGVTAALVAGAGGAYAVGHTAAKAGQTASRVTPTAADATFSGASTHVAAAVSAANATTSSTTPTVLPGMQTTVTVPAGATAVIDARFTSEGACYGGGVQPNWCVASIFLNRTEMAPGDGRDMAYASTDNGANSSASWNGYAIERVAQVTNTTASPKTYTVTVLGWVTDFGATGEQIFWTGERSLVVNY